MDPRGPSARPWIAHGPVSAAAKQQWCAPVLHTATRLVEKCRTVLAGDNSAACSVGRVLGEHDLTLKRTNRSEIGYQARRECVGCDHHTTGPNHAGFRDDVHVLVAGQDSKDTAARVQLNTRAQRALEQTAHVLERVIGPVAADEAAQI